MTQPSPTSTVMIVDDTPANLTLLETILQAAGHRVASFPSATLALRAALASPPDIVLLDVLMPVMDGFALCKALKESETLREIPVLFISALGDTDTKLHAFSEGGADYLTKPFQQSEVLARVATHLELSAQRRELARRNRELTESYERLRAVEFMRDQLVHMMVHDLRSPIGGIMLAAQLIDLQSQACTQSTCAKSARQILRTSNALNGMINDVLDISRMEASSMPMDASEQDIQSILRSAMANLGLTPAETAGVLSECALGMRAWCDSKLTTRVVENLVGNALKFAGPSGLRIHCVQATDWVEVRICDQGPGIPKELQGRIFEKFEQAASLKQCGRKGTGLGLFFCKLATEAQGGAIGVESELGQGSTFWFRLPMAARRA